MSASERQAQHGAQGAQSPLETQWGVGVLATGYHPPTPSMTISWCPSHRVDRSDQNSQFNLFFFRLWFQSPSMTAARGKQWQGEKVTGHLCQIKVYIPTKPFTIYYGFPYCINYRTDREQAITNSTFVLFSYLLQLLLFFPDGRQTKVMIPLQISTSKTFLTPLSAACT